MAISLGTLYDGFKVERRTQFAQMPPVGAYITEIQAVKVDKNRFDENKRDLVLRLEICEGEHKGIFHKIYDEQKKSFGNAYFKGDYRLTVPTNASQDWEKSNFENALACIRDSNEGLQINTNDLTNLISKKIGISIREREYVNKNNEVKVMREIYCLEFVGDVIDKKVNPKHLEMRKVDTPADEKQAEGFTKVEDDDCPF